MDLIYLFVVIGLNLGLALDNNDTSVLCGENEIHSECTNGGCQARNCSQIGKPIPCVKMNPKFCIKGCVCEDGYLRALTQVDVVFSSETSYCYLGSGECVKADQCQKERCSGPHEYYSCGGACDNVCATLHEQSQAICPIVNIKCNEMCYCEEGYARDERGECVPIENCNSGPRP